MFLYKYKDKVCFNTSTVHLLFFIITNKCTIISQKYISQPSPCVIYTPTLRYHHQMFTTNALLSYIHL